jgi:protein-tyrosine phosphatase
MLDLSWVTDTLAIGGCFPPDQTGALVDQQVAAIVDLRREACDDAELLARHRIELLHLPTTDFAPISPAHLTLGIAFVSAHLSAGRRVLVHCAQGIGRSVMLGLCVLVARGRTPLDALALAKQRRGCVSPSPAQYEAWAQWLARERLVRSARWTVPTFDEFKAIAYRHLA